MQVSITALFIVFGVGALPAQVGSPSQPHIKHCLVSLIEDVHVPAQERGVLISVPVKEGDRIETDALLAQIDDGQARLQRSAAQTKLQAAQAQAADDIDVRYADAAYKVAKAEYDQAAAVVRNMSNAIPKTEVRRLLLQQNRAALQIDKSQLDRKVAKMNAEVHQAEVKAAEDLMVRQQIRSPVDGMVLTVFHHAGEWVNPGDPVLRVVRMDRLRIEGFLDSAEHNPGEVDGRSVAVTVSLARGRKVQFTGKIVYVSPLIQAGNKYRVRAEVENRVENNQWLLRPGATAEMHIGE